MIKKFEDFINESSLAHKLGDLIDEFKARTVIKKDYDFSYCLIVSEDFQKFLTKKGVHSEVVIGQPGKFDDSAWFHAAVKVGDDVIDLTNFQFTHDRDTDWFEIGFKNLPYAIYPFKKFKKDWPDQMTLAEFKKEYPGMC